MQKAYNALYYEQGEVPRFISISMIVFENRNYLYNIYN